ncbi:MAG TPA: MmgE/PrpD family protein [Burkholderiaceae bacterium]
MSAPSLTEQLAGYWATARLEELPAEVVHAAKRFLLDTLAAGVAGGRTAVVDSVVQAMQAGGSGGGDAVLWGRSETLAPAAAALINGTASHALELDDFGGCGHSGAVVVPAVCALAQRYRISGREALLAIVAGYDVAGRVLDGSGGYRPHNERGWHSTGTCGSYGAAAAAAVVLKAAPGTFADALGVAGTFTGGTWAVLADGALVKRFHPGKASETGVSAALLAQAGLTGPHQVLDAPWGGFYATYAPGIATPQKAVAALGEKFFILRSGIKPYACCRTLHSCIDAMLDIRGTNLASMDSIAALIVHGNAQTKLQFERTDVRNLLEAQFSAPYCLAVTALSGRATLEQFEPLRVDEPKVRALMARTTFRTDRELGSTGYPSLEVVFADGRSEYRDVPFAKGAPEAPLSDAELLDKAATLLGPVLGAVTTRRLIDAVWSLEGCADFAEVTSLLARPH